MTGRICDLLGKSDKEFCKFCPFGFLDSGDSCPIYDSPKTAFADMQELVVRSKFIMNNLVEVRGG